MFTLTLVRNPPTSTKEIQYLNAKGSFTYADIACDPVAYGTAPPREIPIKDGFRSCDSSQKSHVFKNTPRSSAYLLYLGVGKFVQQKNGEGAIELYAAYADRAAGKINAEF